MENFQPTVLFVSGFDPGGGAGLIADTRVAITLNCRTVAALSCHTVQNEHSVSQCTPINTALFANQIDTLIASYDIDTVKIGLIPDRDLIDILAAKLHGKINGSPGTKVILDPVISSGNGYRFCDDATIVALFDRLLPLTTVVTPNLTEAQQLAPDTMYARDMADRMLMRGCEAVLITSEEKSADTLIHRLYRRRHRPLAIACRRLPGRYHGSGCTLSAAIACFCAGGNTIPDATTKASEFTYRHLNTIATVKISDARFSETI